MALQHLHDFSCLQVPYVNLHVFATTHNVLAARSEIGRYAVGSVSVTSVRFDTFRRLRFPKADGRILCTRQYEY